MRKAQREKEEALDRANEQRQRELLEAYAIAVVSLAPIHTPIFTHTCT